MTRGGHRRGGPPPDPNSARSETRGYSLEFLPPEGYDGQAPAFPLPEASPRELEVWLWAWTLPQACAWSLASDHWRWRTVAMWVRVLVRCEAPDATAALYSQLHRFADQIGMTPGGLQDMGWRVAAIPKGARPQAIPAEDQVGERRERRLRGGAS